MNQKRHYQILIIGGGTGGIMVAAQLKRKNRNLEMAIIEPSDKHYYQPAWTLVGAGIFDFDNTIRSEASVIPKGVDWIKDKATAMNPDSNSVETERNGTITYDYLVVSPGLVYDYSLIEGLDEAISKGVVCSNYVDPNQTWKNLQNFKGGNMIFTQPATPIKCGGAPQKIMYLAADYIKKQGLAEKSKISFLTPGSVIFGVKLVAETLQKVLKRHSISFNPFSTPIKIDSEKKLAYFKISDKGKLPNDIPGTKMKGDLAVIPFDFLHIAPPSLAPDFVINSPLADTTGWLDVDKHTLQHKKYSNVFGLGDASNVPTAKTGAAIRKQAPVVIDNIIKLMNGQNADNNSYDGYSSCPMVTGFGKMVLAEFDYDNNFTPDPQLKFMGVFTSYKEHWRLWMLKKYGLPYMYWNRMLKGKM